MWRGGEGLGEGGGEGGRGESVCKEKGRVQVKGVQTLMKELHFTTVCENNVVCLLP